MAIEVYLNGRQLIGTPTTPFAVNAQAANSLCGWVYIPGAWTTATISMFGIYMAGAIAGDPGFTAVQIGTRSTAPNNIYAWTWNGGVLVNTNGAVTFSGNTWYHAAYTYDGTTHSIYINGALIATSTAVQKPGTLDQTFINGYPDGGTNESGNFWCDDIQFYDRTLSAAEVMTIYRSEGFRHAIVQGIRAHYSFNELYSGLDVVSVRDMSGHGGNLILSGTGTAPTYVAGLAGSDNRRVII
jgi:hypothetical protein